MFCEKCGKEFDESMEVCPYCGQQAVSDGVQGEEQTSHHKGNMKKWVLAASALLLACFFVIGAIMMEQNRSQTALELETLQSCSPEEITKYGFIEKGTVYGLYSFESYSSKDEIVTLLYNDSDLGGIVIRDNGIGTYKYSYHGIKIDMDMQEAIEVTKDGYTVCYQDDYNLAFLNEEGDIMIMVTSEIPGSSISEITIEFGKELIQSQLDFLEDM